MKKLICILLSVLMALSVLAFVGCEKKDENVKLGMGIYTTTKVTDATEDAEGKAQATSTVAAITVDAAGKVVSCALDTADHTVKFTADGKGIANDSFKTKYEQGKDYNMVAYGGAAKEWFEQADAFETVVCGKTLDEIKALVAEGNKGSDEVVNAGCTIMINEFVLAIEKAFANAVDSQATTAHTVKIGVDTEQTVKDAAEDKNGSNEIVTTFFAAAVDAEGKITAATTDAVQVTFGFTSAGASTFDTTKAVQTKKEQGKNYGMSSYGTDLNGDGVVKEWNEQAAAFDAACIGKTAGDLNGLLGSDSYHGNDDLQAAGCTMGVSPLVKAAAKIAK